MQEGSPHEIHAPKAVPIFKGSSRSDKLALTLILLVVFALGGGATWWFLQDQSPAAAGPAGKKTENRNTAAVKIFTNQPAANSNPLFADSDSDNLLDDVEELYGADLKKTDTDADGFSDGMEVASGYDPLNPAKGKRLVDLALVERLAKDIPNVQVLSSGLSTGDRQRYYLAYDGVSTSYYEADGTLKAQCQLAVEPTGTCGTLPNELRTDFSRSFIDGTVSDAFHAPF